jgi:hypothetical protein
MPVARYFLWVGGALLAVLLIANWSLPGLPDAEKASVNPPLIRIQSEQKWPERIVYDTSREAIVPAPSASARPDKAPPAAVANVLAMTREAFAEAPASDSSKAQSVDQKKPDAKPHAKRKVTRRRSPVLMVERRPQFGWYGPTYW